MPDVASPPLGRRLLAGFIGTGLLVAVVIGSGIAAQQLSPNDTGLPLLQNSITTVFGLGVLILLFGPVSGVHFNSVVSAAAVASWIGAEYWFTPRRRRSPTPR